MSVYFSLLFKVCKLSKTKLCESLQMYSWQKIRIINITFILWVRSNFSGLSSLFLLELTPTRRVKIILLNAEKKFVCIIDIVFKISFHVIYPNENIILISSVLSYSFITIDNLTNKILKIVIFVIALEPYIYQNYEVNHVHRYPRASNPCNQPTKPH